MFSSKQGLVSSDKATGRAQTIAGTATARRSARTTNAGLYYAGLIASYMVITLVTRADFMGDTNVYVRSVIGQENNAINPFWDFGHLLWRPLGRLVFLGARPLTRFFVGDNQFAQAAVALIAISWVAGLVCLLFFFAWARRVLDSDWGALVATLAFGATNAFLNYLHTGSAYIPGLALVVIGMYVLWRGCQEATPLWRTSLGSALALAVGVLLYFPLVFLVPVAIATPWILDSANRRCFRAIWQSCALCLALGIVAYTTVILALGIRTLPELKTWVLSAGHGYLQSRGVMRLMFALPRSFISMGNDGTLFKRYVVHDPYAPVTLWSLFQLSFWRLLWFYAFFVALCWALRKSDAGRKILTLILFSSILVFVYAVLVFEAGARERYMLLYPFVFLGVGQTWKWPGGQRATKVIILGFVAAMAIVNVNAMNATRLHRQADAVAGRLQRLVPLLKPSSRVYAVDVHEDISEFKMNFPLHPLSLHGVWGVYNVVEISAESLSRWRATCAITTVQVWRTGGDVWLSKRLLTQRPRPEWNWVEGADPRIKWTDLPTFFSQFDTGETVGGDDGFVLLLNSPRNKEMLAALEHN